MGDLRRLATLAFALPPEAAIHRLRPPEKPKRRVATGQELKRLWGRFAGD